MKHKLLTTLGITVFSTFITMAQANVDPSVHMMEVENKTSEPLTFIMAYLEGDWNNRTICSEKSITVQPRETLKDTIHCKGPVTLMEALAKGGRGGYCYQRSSGSVSLGYKESYVKFEIRHPDRRDNCPTLIDDRVIRVPRG